MNAKEPKVPFIIKKKTIPWKKSLPPSRVNFSKQLYENKVLCPSQQRLHML